MVFRKRNVCALINLVAIISFPALAAADATSTSVRVSTSKTVSSSKTGTPAHRDQIAVPGNAAPAVYEVPANQLYVPTVVAAAPAVVPQAVPWPLVNHGVDQVWVPAQETVPVEEFESPLLTELREKLHVLKLNPTITTDNELNWRIQDSGYKLELAYLRLAKTAAWRRSSGADGILKWHPPGILTNKFPYEFTGFTRDGFPVFYIPLSQWDFIPVIKAGHGPDVFNYIVRMLEDIRNSTIPDIYHKPGGYTSCPSALKQQAVIIIDVGSYGLKNFLNVKTNTNLVRIVKTIGRHYPYLAKKVFVVRASLAAQGMWSVMRKVATPPLNRAVEVYNRFSRRGQYALLHNIPRNAIPVHLGGHFVPTTFDILDDGGIHAYVDHGHGHEASAADDAANTVELNFGLKINRLLQVDGGVSDKKITAIAVEAAKAAYRAEAKSKKAKKP